MRTDISTVLCTGVLWYVNKRKTAVDVGSQQHAQNHHAPPPWGYRGNQGWAAYPSGPYAGHSLASDRHPASDRRYQGPNDYPYESHSSQPRSGASPDVFAYMQLHTVPVNSREQDDAFLTTNSGDGTPSIPSFRFWLTWYVKDDAQNVHSGRGENRSVGSGFSESRASNAKGRREVYNPFPQATLTVTNLDDFTFQSNASNKV